MKKTISFGKVDGYGNGRKTCEVTLELELREDKEGRPVFSVCGNLWNCRHTDILWGGQCVDSLAEQYKSLRNNKFYMRILDLWQKYHLNDMHAGTPEQEKAIKEWKAQGNTYDHTKACDYLKEIGLYEVDLNGEKYKYGHSWLYEEIPAEDLEEIKLIIGVD